MKGFIVNLKKHYQTHIQTIYILVDLYYKISDDNPCIKCILDLYRRATQSLSPTHNSCMIQLLISHWPSWPFPPSRSLWQEPRHYCKVHWVTSGGSTVEIFILAPLDIGRMQPVLASQSCQCAESKRKGLVIRSVDSLKRRKSYGWLSFEHNSRYKEELSVQCLMRY